MGLSHVGSLGLQVEGSDLGADDGERDGGQELHRERIKKCANGLICQMPLNLKGLGSKSRRVLSRMRKVLWES